MITNGRAAAILVAVAGLTSGSCHGGYFGLRARPSVDDDNFQERAPALRRCERIKSPDPERQAAAQAKRDRKNAKRLREMK